MKEYEGFDLKDSEVLRAADRVLTDLEAGRNPDENDMILVASFAWNIAHEGEIPAAKELGRRGGKKGGRARAAKLTPEERSAIARKAANARWRNKKTKAEERG